jgi:Tol biopolymer transport system component
MMLAPGARLGPYEVVSALGAGGMGEVYRARDTRLDRVVALKLLPEEFRGRADRRLRFQSEARLISSLNHAHICALFDVGDQDGLAFLVMECLEGETLEDRITRGPLPAAEVVRYATQVIDALDHAHQAGITHRDLKPSNVMLTPGGAKLLDFGLARGPVLDTHAPSSTVSLPATRLTAEGTIIGTFHYMAPEQLEGKHVDARTDIFAFGTLLFEMATGRKAFEGESRASLIASILTAQPPAISLTRPARHDGTLPFALDHIVERCLAKSPDARWQTARDVKLELQWIAGEGSRPAAAPHPEPLRRRYLTPLLAAVAALSAIAAGFLGFNRPDEPTRDIVRFNMALPAGSAIARSPINTRVAVSPDGRRIAFVVTNAGVDQLWVQTLDSLAPLKLADGAESPFWSPDSRYLGFFAAGDGQLKKVDAAGGPARVICPAAIIDVPVWHPNGSILFAQLDVGISQVSADGGTPKAITRLNPDRREINHMWPAWLPDGKHFLYTATSLNADGIRAPRSVYARALDSEETTLVMRADSRMMFAPPGHLLYVEQGVLLSQPFDTKELKLVGEAKKIAEDLTYERATGNAAFSVSETGVLAYHGGMTFSDLVWFDRAGRATDSGWNRQPFGGPIRISPDGERVIADLLDPRAGSSDIWIYDLSRRVPTRFTTEVTDETGAAWAPDGRSVVFSSDRGGANDLFAKSTDGLGDDALVFARSGPQVADDWSPDGKSLVFEDNSRETGLDLWMLSFDDGRKPRPLIRTRFQEWGARISPDGGWMAFVSNESGASEVYVAPLAGSGEKKRISTGGGVSPRWRRDGKELFYVAPETNSLMAVRVTTGPTLTVGQPATLFATRRDTGPRRRLREIPYDVSADGQRFLFNSPPEQQPVAAITVVLNWPAILPR